MLELQRTVGNAAAGELVTEPPRSNPTVHGGGPSVSLHGDTTAEYDGGVSNCTPKSMKRVKTCTECPDDDPCLHAVGTFNVAYNAKVTIQMPDVPDGLTECPDDDACALFCVMCWIPMRANTPGGSAPKTARPPIRSLSPVAAPAHFRSTCRRFTTPRRRSGMPMPTLSLLPLIRSTGRSTSTARTEARTPQRSPPTGRNPCPKRHPIGYFAVGHDRGSLDSLHTLGGQRNTYDTDQQEAHRLRGLRREPPAFGHAFRRRQARAPVSGACDGTRRM